MISEETRAYYDLKKRNDVRERVQPEPFTVWMVLF